MKVSIIISTYNGEQDIRPLLDSIRALDIESFDLEVILRDDNSSDATVAIIEQEYRWVRLIQGKEKNIGFAASNNIAFQLASGDILCCVNQDTVLHPEFITKSLQVLDIDSSVMGINSNMIMPWVMSLEQFKKWDKEDFPAHEYQLTPYGFARYVAVDGGQHATNFMTGGGFFVRMSSISQDNYLFDPEIDMYCEDTELSLRIQKRGGGIVYSPESIIYHNQHPRQARGLGELFKLVKVTFNRFSLFSRIKSPFALVKMYPLLLAGIVRKIAYLGLPTGKEVAAYMVSGGVTLLFFCLFPYWFIVSLRASWPSIRGGQHSVEEDHTAP